MITQDTNDFASVVLNAEYLSSNVVDVYQNGGKVLFLIDLLQFLFNQCIFLITVLTLEGDATVFEYQQVGKFLSLSNLLSFFPPPLSLLNAFTSFLLVIIDII